MNAKWIKNHLTKLLEFEVPPELLQLIMNFSNESDLEDYLKSLLDFNNSNHRNFINELKKRKALSNSKAVNQKSNDNQNVSNKFYKNKKGKANAKQMVQLQQKDTRPESVDKKKTKFVNLYSKDRSQGDIILLKGRYKCNCEAQKHLLINNCQNCGRIVCEQEQAGPCFFCNEFVCSQEEQALLSLNSKQDDDLYNAAMSEKPNKSLQDLIKHRDRLYEYERNSSHCTKVIDDESDYYQSTNNWLTPAERKKLKKQEEEMNVLKHKWHLNKKVTLDFAGKQVIEEHDPVDMYSVEQFQELLQSIPIDEYKRSNICPNIEFNAPKYIEGNTSISSNRARDNIPFRELNRVQDKEYLEITDKGLCLSMHQPYASLLVAGIKKHEGRTWYSPHRGRLWIASTSKIASSQDIIEAQSYYSVLKGDNLKFPENYSRKVLLGFVTVVDVLSQEEYRKIYPDGESDSPYVFICENFCNLPIKFPIQGKHKIYQLDQKIHHAALKSLEKLTQDSNN